MHPNPAFRGADRDRCLGFARARGFGALTIQGPDGPLAAHVPFVIDAEGARLHAHLVKSNPIRRALAEGPARALLIVSGPDGYISPDWYGRPELVPTWNYVAVHLRGALRLRDEALMRRHLDELSESFEARLLPKTPWTAEKMNHETLARLMRTIVPVEMDIETADGTWKLGQNREEGARLAAAAALELSPIGAEQAALAALMKAPPV